MCALRHVRLKIHLHEIGVICPPCESELGLGFPVFLVVFQYLCNELGKGRPRLETGATDDGLSGFLKEYTQSGDGIYDLMIRNITVHNYNKDRSQPVTIQCIYTWVGAPVDRRRLTGMICPDRALISVRIIVPFFCMASRPLSTSHQSILAIDIV